VTAGTPSAATLTQSELADALLGLDVVVVTADGELTGQIAYPIATAAAIFTSADKESR
jgi:hypothetical protein